MKYPYIVNKNGVWYSAGAEVPEGAAIVKDEKKEPQYTKTEINRMPLEQLKTVASEVGISDYDSKTGGELKKELIEHFA